jgi:predicted acylesterase/phospholipase RssA
MLPKRLVLSGGGARIICHAGALKAFEEAGLFVSIREFVGASAGAIAAMALAIGYSIAELTEHLLTFDFSELQDPNAFDVDNVLGSFETNGLDNGDVMLAYFARILEQRGFSPRLTFAQLRRMRGITLRVIATDVHQATPFEFSPTKTPDISILEGVLASVAIPFYFSPRKAPKSGHWLADGGLLYHYPLPYLSEAEQKEAIGICLCTRHDSTEQKHVEDEPWLFFKRIIQFILQPPRMPHERLLMNTVYIETPPSFVANLSLTPNSKKALLESAYKQTQESLRVKANETREWLRSPIARRHSV